MREFHFHEDDVGRIQILPIENWAYCEREFAALIDHDKAHRAPDGVGWTKMYRLSDDADALSDIVSLRSLEMSEARFVELLSPHGPRFDKLVSPLSEVDEELGIRSVGFGPSEWSGIVADLDGDMVTSIWCTLPGGTAENDRILARMLSALSRDHHLLLVDWARRKLVDLRADYAIESFLRDGRRTGGQPANLSNSKERKCDVEPEMGRIDCI